MSRQPTRDELRQATVMGLLAAQEGRDFTDCRFRTDGGPWEAAMRRAWVAGWTAGNADQLTLDDDDPADGEESETEGR